MNDSEKRLLPATLLPANFDMKHNEVSNPTGTASKLKKYVFEKPNAPLTQLFDESDNQIFLKVFLSPRYHKKQIKPI